MTTRFRLEHIRSLGLRLVAGDEERLYDMEQDDYVYCSSCGQFFALRSDEVKFQEEAWARHMASEEHKNRGKVDY